jgi:2-polyprenyl-6-methoxyphenol hydroxylase-like FAD-dependent oxidoreductase
MAVAARGLALGSEADPVSSLRRYERVRSARTRTVVKRGRRVAMVTTTSSKVVDWLRAAALQVLPERAMLAAFMFSDTRDPHRALRS